MHKNKVDWTKHYSVIENNRLISKSSNIELGNINVNSNTNKYCIRKNINIFLN